MAGSCAEGGGMSTYQHIDWSAYPPGDYRAKCPSCGRPPPGDKTMGITIDSDGSGVAHCFRCEFVESHHPGKPHAEMTPAERQASRERFKAREAQRRAEEQAKHQAAATEAGKRWQQAKPCTEHPYLTSKGVKAYGLRSDASGALLVPMRDMAGTLHSLQTITPDGEKRFFPGGRVKGCYHAIGNPKGGALIVCEGYATGASIQEATGQAVAIAFNAGNLEAVAPALRAKYTALKIVVAADDDHQTEGNPGITKASW
ncbi:MAG: toprim domain-containing protein [Sphingobacteriales bacterium]|nr:MAG: toprim domain-containing protein [Sphingobacteriales bacterium]